MAKKKTNKSTLAKKRKVPIKKAPSKKPPSKKVWHIFRFTERFEYLEKRNNYKKNPLIFTKDYVGSGRDNESIALLKQLAEIKVHPNRHVLQSSFYDLKNVAANQSFRYRGYLLDGRFEPATNRTIAMWIGLKPTETKKTLEELRQIGLIERVTMPEFDPADDETTPPKDDADESEKSDDRKKPEKTGENRKAPAKKKKEKENKTEKKTKRGVEDPSKEKKPETKTNSEAEAKGKDNPKAKDQDKAEPTLRPTATPPIYPTKSDSGVAQKATSPVERPRSINPDINRTVQLYDSQAKEFGGLIFATLEVRYDPLSPEGKSELANYAVAWTRAQMAGLGPRYLNELWDSALRAAERVAIRRRRGKPFKKSAEALWRWLFSRLLEKTKQEAADEDEQLKEMMG